MNHNCLTIFHNYYFLSKEKIENLAEEIIIEYDLKFPIDPTFVAEKLGFDTHIIDIPAHNNEQIAAMLLPLENKIIINENNTNNNMPKGYEESSIAHEIGHWLIHINHRVLEEYQSSLKKGLTVPKFSPLHRTYNNYSLSKIEYQAQYFASCLLMPKFQLNECIKYRDLTNWSHLYAIADELSVTISNLKNRLQEINLIYIPKNSKRIYLK